MAREGSRVVAIAVTGLTGEATLTLRGLAPGEHKVTLLGSSRTVVVEGEPLTQATATDFWLAASGGQARRRALVVDGRLTVDGASVSEPGVTAAVAADWDLDGLADLVFAGQEKLWLSRGQAEGGFETPRVLGTLGTGTVTDLLIGDWNYDGAADLMAGYDDGGSYFAGRGDGMVTLQFRQPGYRLAGAQAEGDWNGDGVADVFVFDGDGAAVWAGDGRGGFVPARVPERAAPRRVAVGRTAVGPAVTGGARAATVWGNTSFGVMYTIAGTGTVGYAGDGGQATAARIANPEGVAVDSLGNLYIADTLNSRIRRVSAVTKAIDTVAGTGTPGSSGDGGLAIFAQLAQPKGLATDGSGNVFFAEYGASRVRKVDISTGVITTVAGNGSVSSGGDGGPATAAQIWTPYAVALDGARNLYITELGGHRVRRVDAQTGIISTVAGTGTPGYSGDNGPGAAAQILSPTGIAVDANGNVFFADSGNSRIRRIDALTGVITTVAGTGVQGTGGEGVAATASAINGVSGVAVDAAGAIYYLESSGARVRRVSGGIVNTIAGSGAQGYSGDGGAALSATMSSPSGLAVDGGGNVYIADTLNQRIRFVDRSSPYMEFGAPGIWVGDAAGTGSMPVVTTPPGSAWSATRDGNWLTLSNPAGFGSGNIGFSFARNTSLYSRTATVTLNNAYSFPVTQAGAPASLTLNKAVVGAAGGSGQVSLNVGNGVNWRVDVQGTWLVANPTSGSGPATITYSYAANGGTAARMGLLTIAGRRFAVLQVGTSGDYSQFGKIPPGVIQTIAGQGATGYSGDGGPATAAQLVGSGYTAVDGQGNIYFPSSGRIRKIDAATGVINRFAGVGALGFGGDGGPALQALFGTMGPIAFDSKGNLYISDMSNERIRRIDAVTGIVTTIAGTGNRSSNGDGGLATLADLNGVSRMAIDGLGNIYLGEVYGRRIRQIHGETGIIRTVAGTGVSGTGGDGGLGVQARFLVEQFLAADEAGDLYIGDGYLRKLTMANGLINKVGGQSGGVSSGDGGPVANADFTSLGQVSIPASGELILGDAARVRRVGTNGIIETIAGIGGLGAIAGDGGLATLAEISYLGLNAVDSFGNVYLPQQQNNAGERIRYVSMFAPSVTLGSSGAAVAAAAGTGTIPITVTPFGAGWGAISKASWLTVTPSGVGGQVAYSYAANTGLPRSGIISIGGQDFTVTQGAGTLPSVVSGTPVNPSGATQLLTLVGRDPDGRATINRMSFVIGPVGTSNAGTCSGYYEPATNNLFLYNDAGTATLAGVVPGSGNTAQNSQCALISGGSSVPGGTGTDLTLYVLINLVGTWATTPQKIWFSVKDNDGNDTGWVQTGMWMPVNLNRPPSVVAISPSNPAGNGQTFSLTGRDPDGFQNIARISFLIGQSAQPAAGACNGYYDRTTNGLYVFDDTSGTWIGPATPGGPSSAGNWNVCSMVFQAVSTTASNGTDVSITLLASMFPSLLATSPKVFVSVKDLNGYESAWVQMATWAPTTAPASVPPTITLAQPVSPVGPDQTFTIVANDANGYANIQRIELLVSTASTTLSGVCRVLFDRAANTFALYNDAGTATPASLTPAVSGTVENSQCTLKGAPNLSETHNGPNQGITLALSLKAAFAGVAHNVYVRAVDAEVNDTGWILTGGWAATNAAEQPTVLNPGVTPSTGNPVTLTATGRDPNGFADIQRVYFLINTTGNGNGTPTVTPGSCHGFYDRAAGAFFLYDAGLTVLAGPLTPGASGTLPSSVCTLEGAGSTPVVASGTDLTVPMRFRMPNPVSGVSVGYAAWTYVVDTKGNGTGWVNSGFFDVPPPTTNNPPVVASATPAAPSGSPQTFSVVARDPDGNANIKRVYFLVNADSSIPQGTCHGYYDRALNAFFLYNDALTRLEGPLTPGANGTIQNSQCLLSGLPSAPVTVAGADMTMTMGLSLLGAYSTAAKKVYFWVVDAEDNGTGWVQTATWTPGSSNVAPVVVVGTPAAPQGSPQVFRFVARDGNGFTDLDRVYFLVNANATVPVNTCHGLYDRKLNAFYLYNDALTALEGPLTPGTAGTIQNGQCAIDGATSSPVTGSGTDLSMAIGINLKGGFAASSKNVYTWVTDASAAGTGWVQLATWAPPVANQPPVFVSATPSAATGLTQTFALLARDPNGFANIQRIYFQIHTSATVPVNTCHGMFDRALNAFYLYNDALTVLQGPLTPGSAGTLQNGQCTIDGPGSSPVSFSGTDLSVRMSVRLNGSYTSGTRNLYAWVTDNEANGTGWQQAATWTNGAANQAPVLVSAIPTQASGASMTLQAVVRDMDGVANLSRVYFLVHTTPSVPSTTCHGFYDRALNAFYMYSDGLTSLMGPLTAGSNGALVNTQCALTGAGLSASGTGTDLTLTFPLIVNGSFGTGSKNVYLWVTDNDGAGTGWLQTTTWTFPVGSVAPVLVSTVPGTLIGANQTITITARDGNGYTDVNRIYFLVNTSASVVTGGCHGFYDRATNAYYLYDDALQGLIGPVTPRGIGSAQNSQCIINGAGSSSFTGTGTDGNAILSLSLKGAFASGNKNLYLWVTDTNDLGTGWVPAAAWTLP